MLRDEWFNYNEKWNYLNQLPKEYRIIKRELIKIIDDNLSNIKHPK